MLSIRRASIEDLPQIMDVEQSWNEEGRAGIDKFHSRLEHYKDAFFLASVTDNNKATTVVATITALPVEYNPSNLSTFKDWDTATNNGFFFPKTPANANALYIASGIIDKSYRGENIFHDMVSKEVETASELGLRYIVAGAVIPGYKQYCQTNGDISAYDYCSKHRGKRLVDPLLQMYSGLHFHVRNEAHVIPNYFPDDASCNYAALVVRDLVQHPFTSPLKK